MFESGKYSDLTIVTANKSYPVHRALLASRSSFFEGACSNPFRESETGVIDLTEDDPVAVEHMIHCKRYYAACIATPLIHPTSDFYHLDYLKKPLSRRSSQRSAQSTSPRTSRFPGRRPKKLNLSLVEDPLLAMLSAASPSMTPESHADQSYAQDALDVSAKLPDTPMQGQFSDDTFDYFYEEPKADNEQPHLVTHAKVYAIAEK